MKASTLMILLSLCGLGLTPGQEKTNAITPGLREAAEKGDADAEFQLAKACLYGQGIPRDPTRAYELMSSAAAKGHAEAIGALGYFHITGTAVPKDGSKAMECFRKGATLGSAKAQLNLGLCLLGEQDTGIVPAAAEIEAMKREGMEWLRKAAAQHLPEAAARLGKFHYFGEYGLKADYAEAEPWLRIAAEAGNAGSQNMLGVINEQGLSGKRDEPAAESWYRKAAMQGDGKAQSNLGTLLGKSSRSSENHIESVAWLIVGKNNNEITALKSLQNIEPILKPEDKVAAEKMAATLAADIKKNARLFRSVAR